MSIETRIIGTIFRGFVLAESSGKKPWCGCFGAIAVMERLPFGKFLFALTSIIAKVFSTLCAFNFAERTVVCVRTGTIHILRGVIIPVPHVLVGGIGIFPDDTSSAIFALERT
jgi:hypothetical protein